uniref:Uncharacterized protein n=1 Tax=Sphaerodactylus townsendi TaxID=933632 RepID=A0ACB8FPG2_9SAUR
MATFRRGSSPPVALAVCGAPRPGSLMMLGRAGAEARENPPPSLVAARRLVTSTPAPLSYPRGRRFNAVTEGILGEALSTKPQCPGNVTGEILAERSQRSRGRPLRPNNASVQRLGAKEPQPAATPTQCLDVAEARHPARHPVRRAAGARSNRLTAAAASHPIQTRRRQGSRAGQRGEPKERRKPREAEGAECPVLQQGLVYHPGPKLLLESMALYIFPSFQ